MARDVLKTIITILLALALALAVILGIVFLKESGSNTDSNEQNIQEEQTALPNTGAAQTTPTPVPEIERFLSGHDKDNDGIDDFDDIILGARKDAENKPSYRSAYYKGGYPPDDEGVCTDVIWRSFKEAGYNLKDMVDKDIKANKEDYPRVMEGGKPDPNIDFRRVPNLAVFFGKYSKSLTIDIKPGDIENLKEWQGGDIVVFGGSIKHIAVISDKRRPDGVPLIIHNGGPYTQEEDALLLWNEISEITHHFRWITE
ncbi:MAG: DUF1287 domain-containing protein [Bacillota bacterium]